MNLIAPNTSLLIRRARISDILALLALTLTGCTFNPDTSEYRQFRELCDSPSRYVVKRKVKVEGIFVNAFGTCQRDWEVLFDPGVEFYECENERECKWCQVQNNSGEIYRYKLGAADDKRCVDFKLFSRPRLESLKHWTDDRCLIPERIGSRTASLTRSRQSGFVDASGNHIVTPWTSELRRRKLLIWFNESRITNMDTGEILGRSRNYSYWPFGNANSEWCCKEYCESRAYIQWSDVVEPTK